MLGFSSTMSQAPNTERVVVLIPCYKARKYIRAAIESALNQTRKPDLIVALDDRSNDGFEEEIKDLVENRDDVIIHVNPKNLGVSACRNEGLLNYPADFYQLLDADDTCMPERLEKSLEVMHANPDCGIVGSYIYFMNGKGEIFKQGTNFYCLTKEDSLEARKLHVATGLLPSTVLLRGDVVHRDGLLFRAGLPSCEDSDYWARILEAGWDMLTIPEALIGYRLHGESVCSTQAQMMEDYKDFVDENIRLRRTGHAEISWEEFQANRKKLPWSVRLKKNYHTLCYSTYRNGGTWVMNEHYIKGYAMIAFSILLQPSRLLMAFGHLKQFFKRFKKN